MRRHVLSFFGFAAGISLLGADGESGPRLPAEQEVWIRGASAHFTFYSSAGEARVRDLARTLEQLVDTLARTLGNKPSPVPTAVYVFRDDRAFAPYKLDRDGSVKNLSGFFVQHDLGNYVALDGGTACPRVILHEYLHQFAAYNLPPLPAWLNEGMAELYSTFEETDRKAYIGAPIDEHVRWLGQNLLIPLPRLFAITPDDSEYNEAERQGVFYAESWALVHLLTLGKPERRAQLAAFVERLGRGESAREAVAVFGDLDTLQTELRAYVKQNAFTVATTLLEGRDLDLSVRFEAMTRTETLFRLGDLLLRTSERHEDAAAHFRAVLALTPEHAGAVGGLALVDAAAGRWEQAATGFADALRKSPDDPDLLLRLSQALYVAEAERITTLPVDQVPPRVLQAREHAARAVALRPDKFDGQLLLGLTYAFQGKDVEPGIAALERARSLAPGRVDMLLALGSMQMVAGRLPDARGTFEALLRSSADPDQVAQARAALAEVTISQAIEEGSRTNDNAKAAAAIRAVIPDLPPERRAEVQKQLASIEAIRPGVPFSDDNAPPPPLESTDAQAHLRYASRQGSSADRAVGDAGVRLATEATKHFRRAAELDPASADAWLGLALSCIRALCPVKEGLAAAEKALALRPGDIWSIYLLANYRIDAGEPHKAEPLVTPLLDVDHQLRDRIRYTLVRARVTQAQSLLGRGKTGEASRLLQVETMPEGELGEEADRWLARLRKAVQLQRWSDRVREGSEARLEGEMEKARKILEDVIAHCPDKGLVRMAETELDYVRALSNSK